MNQETSVSGRLTQPASIERESKSGEGRSVPATVLVFVVAVLVLTAAIYFLSW